MSGWKSTEWTVVCSQMALHRSDSLRPLRTPANRREAARNSALCANRPDHPVTTLLESASVWLSDLGFRGPLLGDTYDAWSLQRDLDAVEDGSLLYEPRPGDSFTTSACRPRYCAVIDGLWGYYGLYSKTQEALVLSPIDTDVGPDDLWEYAPSPGWGYAEIHELFHAVMASYPGYRTLDAATRGDGWIAEGMAEAVAKAAEHRVPFTLDDAPYVRQWDSPLHDPPENGERGDGGWWDYGSWLFWDWVGESLGSGDRIAYLHGILERLGDASGNGIYDVQRGLEAWGTGLVQLYPRFVADALADPCHFSDLARLEGRDCTPTGDNAFRFAMSLPDTVRRPDHALRPLAAAGFEIRFDIPSGTTAEFTARVPRFADHPALHLIANGEYRDMGPEGPKEVALHFGPGTHTVQVRLAAVPRNPLAPAELGHVGTAPIPAPVEFTLSEFSPCDPNQLVGTVRIRGIRPGQGAEQARAALASAPGFMDVETYSATFERDPALRPAASDWEIRGLLTDGGAGCTDPFGTALPGVTDPDVSVPPDSIDLAAIMSAARSGGDPASIMGMILGADAADQEVTFFTFSPNALSWQTGMQMPAIPRSLSAFQHPVEHPGIGGWNANAAAAVAIRLPGVRPDDIEDGGEYPAVVDVPGRGSVPLYTRWEGSVRTATCARRDGVSLLEGRTETLHAVGTLNGTVTVTRSTGGVVHAEFHVEGAGRAEVHTYRIRNDDTGAPCHMDDVSGSGSEVRTGSIQLAGTLVAPARTAAIRSGRSVSSTVRR